MPVAVAGAFPGSTIPHIEAGRLHSGMTVRGRRFLALALSGLAAACGGRAPKPSAPPSEPQRMAEDMDGVYRGTSTRFRADSRACPSPGLVVLRVVGGSFEYRWNGHTQIESTVAPDGDVQGVLGPITLAAKLADGRMEGDVSNDACAYHFRAVKRPH